MFVISRRADDQRKAALSRRSKKRSPERRRSKRSSTEQMIKQKPNSTDRAADLSRRSKQNDTAMTADDLRKLS